MIENRNYLQKYAMHFGTYMGAYWIFKFILFPLGFTIPFLSFLYLSLTLGVPFLGYHYAKTYRNKVCGGVISFAHACLFTLFMYMFASLLVAVAHYIYFQFIDHGFVLNEYSKLVDEASKILQRTDEEKEFIRNVIDTARTLTPVDFTMQFLSWDVIVGSLLAIPTGLFVMKRGNRAETPHITPQP